MSGITVTVAQFAISIAYLEYSPIYTLGRFSFGAQKGRCGVVKVGLWPQCTSPTFWFMGKNFVHIH
jgi:hypothetical protein